MTERKPAGVPFETFVDRQIREATERGEFDNVPGQGQPITNLDQPYDAVWAARHLEREGANVEGMLPASLRLRRQIERLRNDVRDLRREEQVRDVVAALNERIRQHQRVPEGPPVPVRPVDAEAVVEQWRADRADDLGFRTPKRDQTPDIKRPAERTPRRRWWQLLCRRSG